VELVRCACSMISMTVLQAIEGEVTTAAINCLAPAPAQGQPVSETSQRSRVRSGATARRTSAAAHTTIYVTWKARVRITRRPRDYCVSFFLPARCARFWMRRALVPAGAEVIALCRCRRRVRWGRCDARPKRRGAEHSQQKNSLLGAKMVATTRSRLATHRRRQPSLACERENLA
jgi:hypothetical protein